jgi:tryptophanyl-tRNA synthetase
LISIIDKLRNNKNIFLFYELIFNNHTQLALNEIFVLDIIKYLLEKNPEIHLIIQISDDELYSKGKFKFHEVSKFALEKSENVIKFISTEKNKNQIHIFANSSFRLKDNNYESLVSNFKMKVSYDKVTKLFNITEDDPVSALDYPCYIAMATNPELYTNYIPQIKKDFTCLIINSIYNMNRYQLAFDAAKINNFQEPILLATKIIPPLTGTNGYECNYNSIDNITLLSNDEKKTLENKIKKHAISGSRGSGSLEEHQKLGGDVIKDISCQYLAFIEKNVDKYKETIDKFGKGQISCGETKKLMLECVDGLFKCVREAKIDNANLKEFFIVKDT